MGLILEFFAELAAQLVTGLFGEAVAKDKPFWVRAIAEMGCFFVILFVAVLGWVAWKVSAP